MSFSDKPAARGLPTLHDSHWDPFWKACCDEGTVVCMHIGSGAGMSFDEPNAPAEIIIASTPINSLFQCALNLVYSKTLRKFSGLKIALSEGGIGWIPYFLEPADYTYKHHRHWAHQDFGDTLPSDPEAPERLWEGLDGAPDQDIDKITHGNAMRHFQYDPFAHRPRKKCSVGALRAEATGVDLSQHVGGGGKPPSAYEHGFVTIGDLQKQIATAFATPFDHAVPALAADEALARARTWGNNQRG